MAGILSRIFGTKNDRIVRGYQQIIPAIDSHGEKLLKLSDSELKAITGTIKEKIANGASLDSVLPETFALVREGSKRALGIRHYDVQLIGGMALNDGNIAEMKTGEGKTLTATLPTFLNALAGKGAHLVTVNDYLAKRDAEWMGKLYNFLGLSVGTILHGMDDEERKAAYACDITYGTNNEFGFDYLRDNMKTEIERCVQREHFYCIVDEVDSILIDEARTPLIISGPAETKKEIYLTVNTAIPGLQKDSDYIVDEKARSVVLTDDGITKMEKRLNVENLYEPKNIEYLHHVQQALKAHIIFKKDVDYVVKDGEIVIVDEFTGRLMPGRRYSDGLHGALEAKEHVKVENESQVLASITFQNYFRLYEKLSGMTGTADTEAVEFKNIYNLDVVAIPTNKPLIRKDEQDEVYRTSIEKYNVIADDIAKAQTKGQPVLVGTVSVEMSELLANLLKKRNIPHEILNAKNHGREATIIANAGCKGNVTISTNMAGRGTDIVLGEGVKEIGGLFVIGTERHESRRIDNQLRGRAGRQGDPGRSKFYLSLEDDLMRIFASDKLSAIMGRLGMKEGEAIVSPMVSRAIERAQKRVEEQNFSSRKHVLEYDDVMNQQRKVVYERRRAVLENKADFSFFEDSVKSVIETVIIKYSPESSTAKSWNEEELKTELDSEFNLDISLKDINFKDTNNHLIIDVVGEQVINHFKEKSKRVPEDLMRRVENFVYLQIIDQTWKDHLRSMDSLQDSVRLRSYAQRDPLQEYKKEAYRLFEGMMIRIEDETALSLVRMPPPDEIIEQSPGFSDSEIEMKHPNPQSALDSEDNLVYHGSHGEEDPEKRPETFTRGGDKVGRNDPCPCGSGKKFKKCCGLPTA